MGMVCPAFHSGDSAEVWAKIWCHRYCSSQTWPGSGRVSAPEYVQHNLNGIPLIKGNPPQIHTCSMSMFRPFIARVMSLLSSKNSAIQSLITGNRVTRSLMICYQQEHRSYCSEANSQWEVNIVKDGWIISSFKITLCAHDSHLLC